MKKIINTDSIANELEGASLFFTKSATPPSLPEPEKVESSLRDLVISEQIEAPKEKPEIITKPKKIKSPKPNSDDTVIPRHHDTMTPRYQDTTTPQIHGVVIELIRKAVKEF